MLIGPSDPLPADARRILIAGTSGSGKTTLARRLASVLGIRHYEIDALFHGPDWQPRPSFSDDVQALTAQPEWITEWQYPAVRDLLADRADLVVWLDLPRTLVMARVLRRSIRRALLREQLWHGNREPGLHRVLVDPDHIVRWSWRTHPTTAARVEALVRRRPELPIVRLRGGREASQWLAGPVADLSRR